MKILLAIVHYWDPEGSGRHSSLRANPAPRVEALKQLILGLRRLSARQYQLHMGNPGIYRTNEHYRHDIDLRLITDGEHTVLDQLDPSFRACFEEVVTQPENGMLLGFEAQNHLGMVLEEGAETYDLYGYLEDDLIIHDPQFFQKISWFQQLMGPNEVLLPQRVEWPWSPDQVEQLFIDGPLSESDLEQMPINPAAPVVMQVPGGDVVFESPQNPHAGCFFLSDEQLRYWMDQPHWLDRDCSFISPLESAATLGLLKTFQLRKTAFSHASWFSLQHWGTSFHSLIAHPEQSSG